ncbi:MAG: AsmA family protein, partial [Gammaproteobacteria bacterium]|nr:AsmA family protein [Gammaproteobacteria bacterium]
MKKILKLFTLLLAFVIIILIATAVFVPLLVDPNEYRQDIAQLVQERTGRSLKIDGDISISVFPWLGLDVGPVQLSNPEGFGASPFARIRSARLRVKLAPLLKRQVEMDTVSLDGLELNLIRNPGGHDNWADLVQSQSDEEPDGTDPGLAALAIGGVELTEARLIWDDRANGSRYTVDNLNLNTGPLELGRPFQVKTTLDLTSSTPDLQGHIELEGLTKVDPSTPSVQVSNARLTFSTDGDSLGIDQGTVELTGNVNLNIAKQTVRIDQTAIGLSISSATHGVKSATANLTGTLSLDQPAQRARIEALRLETDVTTTAPEVHAHTVLSGLLTADMQTLVIALADMHLETSTDSAELGVKAAKGTVTGGLDLNLQDRTALFTKLNLVVDVSGDPAKLPVETARAKLAGDLILDLAGQTVKSDAIKLSADLNTAGPALHINSTVTGRLRADLATPAITLAKALVQADITGTDAGIQKMQGTMTGKLGLNLKQQTVTITGLKLVTDLQADKDQLGVSAVRGEVNGNVNYQLTKQLLTIGKLRVKADVDTGDAGIRAKGSLSAGLTLDLTKPRLTARNLKVDATLTGDPLPEKKVPVKLAANLSTDLASQTFKATDISLDTFGLKIKGGLTGDKILDSPNLQGGVVVAPFNPRILLKKLGQTAPVTADRQALRLASLHGAFSLTPSSVTIPKLQLKIDDTRLTGSIDVTNIAKPAARFDLDVNSINLDRYLPPPGKKHPPSGTKPGDIKDGDSPIAVLGGMDLEGELRIGTLTLNKMHASKINLKLK